MAYGVEGEEEFPAWSGAICEAFSDTQYERRSRTPSHRRDAVMRKMGWVRGLFRTIELATCPLERQSMLVETVCSG